MELEIRDTIRRKKIKVRRALILGNFYNRKVQIVRNFYSGDDTITEVVVGIKPDELITKTGMIIPLSSIECIYQL